MLCSPLFRRLIKKLLTLLGQRSKKNPAYSYSNMFSDDTFLVSYPRSGNTWMRHLIANSKFEGHKWNHKNINEVIPDMYQVKENLDKYARPRIIKSHEKYEKKYPKVIYIYRDSRDVAISYHNYQQTKNGYKGTFRQFLEEYLRGAVPFGSWQDHIISWMFREHEIPFIAVKYEELFHDTINIMKYVLNFLGISATEDTIRSSIEKSSFKLLQESAKKYSPHYKTGYNMGVKGGPGKWKEVFSEEEIELLWAYQGVIMNNLGYQKHE